MPGTIRHPALILFLAVLSAQVGCVALNIPSQRLHDPEDKGGAFGHWKTHHCGQSCEPGSAQACCSEAGKPCLDGGPLGLEDDPLDQMGPQPPEPEVPWPRFHPVPTRPLFYGSVGS
jgi:hypothetical protein